MRKISLILLTLILLLTLISCATDKFQIEGVSKEFSNDFNEVLKVIEKDIKNHNNESSLYITDRAGYKFIQKYKDKILSENEQKVYDIIEEALIARNLNFITTSKEEFTYDEKYDDMCIEILKGLQKIK